MYAAASGISVACKLRRNRLPGIFRRLPACSENPYPAGLEDCYTALKWMHENAGELGLDRCILLVVGGSAGGGLAAALTLLARDRKDPPICFQMLIYPMLDDRATRRRALK